MVNYTTVYVEGKIYWPKIVGKSALHDNYDKQFGGENPGRQWAYELVPDDVSFLKEHRLLGRLKDKADPQNPDKGDFLVLKKPEFTKEGEENEPITIVNNDDNVKDADGNTLEGWDNRRIGNGTRVVAKLSVADFGSGKQKAIYTSALRIEELVPYEGGDGGDGGDGFGGYGGGSKKSVGKAAPKAKTPASKNTKLDDLDDDVPF